MSDLEVQGLVKRFGNNLVVDRVSFHVNDGEFFVLLGPSGGGKTTILRMICGLEMPDDGRIVLNGQDVTKLNPRQRNLGMVFQDYGLYPSMDVYGNIAYGLEARRVPKAEIQKLVPQAAAKLGLTPHLRRSINDLSGGEQQRVALARILVKDADAFLYDEPLSNLDPKLRYQARRDIVSVHRTKQKPSVYVTHDQTEAFAIADRIAVIAKGHLQQVGTSDELIEAPANIFMSRFVGSPPMNLLTGNLMRKDRDYVVQVEENEFALPRKWTRALELYREATIILGIRPQTIVPSWQFASLDYKPQVLDAVIVDVEALIGEANVTLKLGNGIEVIAVWSDETLPESGERMQVGINTEMFCLFDPTTEQAIKV
jgi:multiple sugar transport system ATP-binding protein